MVWSWAVRIGETNGIDERPAGYRAGMVNRHLRIEDALLFGWLLLQPTLFPAASAIAAAGSRRDLTGGLLDLAALVLAAVCVGARSRPGVQSGLVGGSDGIAYAVGPLFGAVAFVLDNTVERLDLTDSLAILPLVLAVLAALVARWRLPPLSAEQRRALVTPFILAASGFFGSFLVGLTDLFDIRTLIAAVTAGDGGWSLCVVGIATLGVLVFYLMLVFAPRQIAEREGTTRTWAVRFVVFLVGLSLGTTLHGLFAVA